MAPQKRMTSLILGEWMDLSTGEMSEWSQRTSNPGVGLLPSVGLPSRGVNLKVGFINNWLVYLLICLAALGLGCDTTYNLPWFMDLTFQVHMQYWSLQHRTLLLLLVTSTNGYCFCFGSFPSFFLELFLHWSPVAHWAPTDLGSSSFSVLSFCLFILFMGFSRQEYWSGLPFPFPWTTFCQNSPPWPVRLGWPYTAWLIVSLS